MDLDDALETFIVTECRELLDDMETALLAWSRQKKKTRWSTPSSAPRTPSRARQGLFSLDHIVAFTHVVESVLDQVRSGNVALGDKLVVLLLACCDHMGNAGQGRGRRGDMQGSPELLATGEPLVAQLRVYLDGCQKSTCQCRGQAPQPN
jgi:two-component system chemotaxis sensor kinase CheA